MTRVETKRADPVMLRTSRKREGNVETRVEQTLVAGKLMREPSDALRRVLISELQSGEVVVSLLETASDHTLGSGSAKVWVALTDRRAVVLATDGTDSYVTSADASTVSHKGKLGRDLVTVGEETYKCPLLRGGSEFKTFAQLAEAHYLERLRQGARMRLEDEEPQAAAALCASGLDREQDSGLLTLRVQALAALEKYGELGNALTALVTGDPELTHWRDLYASIGNDSRVLWMLYKAAFENNVAGRVRAYLSDLRATAPGDSLMAELIARMDADEGEAERGLVTATAWRDRGIVPPKTFLNICTIFHRAGLNSEPLHRQRALTYGQMGQMQEAHVAINAALEVERTPDSLRILADILLRSSKAKEAVVPLEQLLEAGHDDYWIRSKLGEGYEALDRANDAVETRELALERLFETNPETETVASERRALARLHREIAATAGSEERDIRLACAELLDRGLDWAARLADAPEQFLAGSKLKVTIEVLAARRLSMTRTAAGLVYEEAVLDPKAEVPTVPSPPTLLEGGIAGEWPTEVQEEGVVHSSKRSANVRYSIGEKVWVDMDEGLPRGLHTGKAELSIPDDVRPTYHGDRVKGELELEITPPGARFPLRVAPCHEPQKQGFERSEEREGSGKIPIKVRIPDAAWSFGEKGTVELRGWLDGNRTPSKIEVALVAIERMRPPHKGERVVETFSWTFPIFPYELDEKKIRRQLSISLPAKGTTTGFWTWFEMVWAVRVRLLRKEKPEATAEVPILLRFPPLADEEKADQQTGRPSVPPGLDQAAAQPTDVTIPGGVPVFVDDEGES